VTGIIEILSQQDDHLTSESSLYLSDLSSNVAKCLGDCEALIDSTELLRKEFQRIGKRKTGSVLYLLTLVTTIFAPAEFIATVFGMNFKQSDDVSRWKAPELRYRYGYLLFWAIVLVTVSVIFTFYRKKSWI
jgi:magnesium transporter